MARAFIHFIEDDGRHRLIETTDGIRVESGCEVEPWDYLHLKPIARDFTFTAKGYEVGPECDTLSEVTARTIARHAEEAERLREENVGLKADLALQPARRRLVNRLLAGLTGEERELFRDALAFHQLPEEEDS